MRRRRPWQTIFVTFPTEHNIYSKPVVAAVYHVQ